MLAKEKSTLFLFKKTILFKLESFWLEHTPQYENDMKSIENILWRLLCLSNKFVSIVMSNIVVSPFFAFPFQIFQTCFYQEVNSLFATTLLSSTLLILICLEENVIKICLVFFYFYYNYNSSLELLHIFNWLTYVFNCKCELGFVL